MTSGTDTPSARFSAAPVGSFVTLQKIEPSGSLQFRKQRNGAIAFFWRFTFEGKTDRVAIGTYDPTRPPKSLAPQDGRYSVAAARHAAQAIAVDHHAAISDGGHRSLVQSRERRKAEQLECEQQIAKQTLQHLLLSYCDFLKAIERKAHGDARSIFTLHVINAWPNLAKLPAVEVNEEHIADMLRRLFDMGKGRTANKLRAYVRAAYEVARRARSDPTVPVAFKAFGIRHNPAAGTVANAMENKADKDPLSVDEMRRYWKIIEQIPGLQGGVLRLHLVTGGQRQEQLVRLKTADIGNGTILLFDGKGRPGKAPRPHPLPLIPAAEKALAAIAPIGEYALSTDGGVTHLSATTLSRWAVDAATSIPRFRTKRLRSGIETLLAGAGVSKDLRGRLQSHGISGVQAAHYDAHDYLAEKKLALEILFKVLSAG